MVLSPEEIEHFVNGTSKYGSMIGGRWPKGIVPYVIQSSIGKSLIMTTRNVIMSCSTKMLHLKLR